MAVKGLNYQKSAERWRRYGENYHDEARIYYAELNKTALTIGTFLIGFVGIFIQIGNVQVESLLNKILLGGGFIFLTVSVILGIFIFKMMNQFLNDSGDYYEKLSENMNLWMLKNGKNCGQKYPDEIYQEIELKNQANNQLSIIQLSLLGIGFVCVSVYFILLLI